MTNTYGYNRKTPEEDKVILQAVKRHHDIVTSEGYLVVMTSLIGSQNYDLDSDKSDIDTFSLIYPSLRELARADDPQADLIATSDGYCNYKDIRLALSLLQKTSPNSVEYFVSKYKVYNPLFEDILKEYLDDNTKAWSMIHCNYGHMLYAMAGMAHQLTKRNMPTGKRYAHALRLDNMQYHFLNSLNASAVLDMRPGGDRDLALEAKYENKKEYEDTYNEQCEQIATKLDTIRDEFQLTKEKEQTQKNGLVLIDGFRDKLFKRYLEVVNK